MPRPLRAALGGAFIVYLGVVTLLLLNPSPALGSRAVVRVVAAADRFGVGLPTVFVEFGLNVLLVVPLSLLGGLLFPRLRPTTWVAGVFVGSLSIEVAHLVALSARSGTSRDVVANTLGALLGVGACWLVAARTQRAETDQPTVEVRAQQPSASAVEVRAEATPAPVEERAEATPAPVEVRTEATPALVEVRAEATPALVEVRAQRASKPLSPPIKAALLAAYAVYLASVVYLVWSPNPAAAGNGVTSVVDLAASFGVVLSASAAERGLNVLMLVPFSLIGGLLLRRLSFSDWVVAGFVLSATVEIGQRLVLPTRSGSARDIVANTLGSLIGAVALIIILALLARRTARSRPRGRSFHPTEAK